MKIEFNDLLDTYENIIYKNSKNKQKVIAFEKHKMTILYNLYTSINNETYKQSGYNIFLIKRPKHRIVMSLNISDKIVNHYVTIKYLIPTLEKYLDYRNIATRKGMGNDYGIRLIKKYLEKNKKYSKFYILKLDIKKYFYNIDHNVLENMLKDKFDKPIFDFICRIIESTNDPDINIKINNIKTNSLKYRYNKAIDNLPFYKNGKGLPIGNMTSQFFAIYYLSSLDHYIIHDLHLKYFIRYMDDFVIIHHDKNYLKKCKDIIEFKLNNEFKLELNEKSRIYSSKEGFDLLGYNFKVINNKTIIKVSTKTYNAIKNNIKMLNKELNDFSCYANYTHSFKYLKKSQVKYYLERHFN